jgi:hypothetical protein
MKFKFFKAACTSVILSISSIANAGLIVEYDYLNATSSSNLVSSFVDSNYTASDLLANGISGTGGFGNHFYHSGWDSSFNSNKYYNLTVSSLSQFQLTSMAFSLENTSGTSTFWLRSNLDGFVSNISSGNFISGLVTDFTVDLTSLSSIVTPIEFRFYIASTSTAGFANHQCKPAGSTLWDAGCGGSDVGLDLSISGSKVDVPEPSTLAIFALGMIGLASRRFKKQS